MNLFVCYTHLQLVIASRIIALRNIRPDDIEIFYISKIDNDVTKNTLQDMRNLCGEVTFIHMKLKYPLYFPSIFKHFFQRRYDSVFIASIDNVLIHFIISRAHFNHLYTFDDGSANIIPGSIYYQSQNAGVIEKLCRAVLMIHFDMPSIKNVSEYHYTIYDGYKNIIPRTISIDMFPSSDENFVDGEGDSREPACNVILGSVYFEIFDAGVDIQNRLNRCWKVVKESDRDTYYIPHPRELKDYTENNITRVKAKYIAEQEVLNFLKRYKCVYLYGFLSSCQINLACHPNVINRVFYSAALIPAFNNAIKSQSHDSFEVINVDDEEQ